MRILIADDDATPRRMLQAILQKWDYEVVVAANGAEAWDILQGENAPQLAILDWLMPEMDGVEVCRRMRQRPDAPYVYFILLTSKDRREDVTEGMDAGADDYLTKPFEPHRLQVRLRVGRRILDLQSALLASVSALAQAREREVEIGARIQQTLLLGQPPADLRGVKVGALTIPSQQIDGDFYDFFPHSQRCLDVIVGDVMGKGVPAALFGAAVKSHFLRALSTLLSAAPDSPPQPEAIVAYVHGEVTREFIGLESFMTLCYARFDHVLQQVTFVDCGHTKTIHLSNRTGGVTTMEGDSLPLGVSEREVYRQVTAPFGAGDLFCFYSDGVTEARSRSGELFGFDRLVDAVRANGHLAPDAFVESIRRTVVEFTGAETFPDDLTCVAVRIDDAPAGQGAAMAAAAAEPSAAEQAAAAAGPDASAQETAATTPSAALAAAAACPGASAQETAAAGSGVAAQATAAAAQASAADGPGAAAQEAAAAPNDDPPLARLTMDAASELSELTAIRAFVRDFCRSAPPAPVEDGRVDELELAVNEAASNIMRHAYDGRTDLPIRVEAESYVDRVIIHLFNTGKPFDPAHAPAPAFDGTREGGFGVFMIANSVEIAEYFRDPNGRNGLTLVKFRSAGSPMPRVSE